MENVAFTGGKIVTKVGLNMACPGLGSAVDFLEGFYDIYQENYGSAVFNIGSGFLDLGTLGLYGTAKTIAKDSGKEAAITTVKTAAKSSSKQIGKDAAKQIAKGAHKIAAAEMAKSAAKEANKEIGEVFAKELSKGMLKEATDEAFKRSIIKSTAQEATISLIGSGGKDVTKEVLGGVGKHLASEALTQSSRQTFSSASYFAAKEGAKVVADEYYKKALAKDVIFNTTKGAHNYFKQ